MLCTVLKIFNLSRDGLTTVGVTPSEDPIEIPDALVPGLEAEGFVQRVKAGKPKPAAKPKAEKPNDESKDGDPGLDGKPTGDETPKE